MDNSRKPVKNADDRPINSKGGGQYNMNFIDWNNEWCAVYNKGYDMNNPDPNRTYFHYERTLPNSWNVCSSISRYTG